MKPYEICEGLQKAPEKKTDNYGGLTENDYIISGEIMVTITLREYRELLTKSAKSEASEARSKQYSAERERDAAKKELEEVNKRLDRYEQIIAKASGRQETESDE